MRGPGPEAWGRDVEIVAVSGGVAGLAASTEAMSALAATMAAVGVRLGGRALLAGATAADSDLACSAALAPETFALAEAALLRAVAGPDGATLGAPGWEALALAVRAAAAAYAEVDEQVRGLVASGVDRGLAGVLPGVFGAAALTGLVTGHRPLHALLGTVGAGYPTGTGQRTTPRPDLTVAGLGQAPGSVAGLAGMLAAMSALSGEDRPQDKGTVAVQTLLGPDGRRRHVVYLPGTDDLRPWSVDDDVRDMAANLELLGGRETAHAAGVLSAMAQAGIAPGEPVLLAGHSQGGMQAAALASQATPYAITDVVTLGSPLAQVGGYASGTQVLSIENAGDVVPDADAAANPDTVGHVTVTFASADTGLSGNHDFTHYVSGAAAVDASAHPSVVAAIDGLAEFLDPQASASGQVFQIVRAED